MNRQEYSEWFDRADFFLDVEGGLDEPIRTLVRHVHALQDRIDQLMDPDDHDQLHVEGCRCSYVRCACAYGHPDAICMVHAPVRGLSLGEQPHGADGCHKQGRPHLGPCISA